MGFITYGQEIGIFASNYGGRLDIGTKAFKKQQSADHVSWATKLKIKRLDGPSTGDVQDNHIIGIFTENEEWRLDIGTHSMKETVSAKHESWATKLKICPAVNRNTKRGDRVKYDDIIGVFSSNEKHRLDLGTHMMKKKQSANHNSWATNLLIQDSDPIVEVGAISKIDYDLENVSFESTSVEEMYNVDLPNNTNIQQKFELSKTFSISETKTFENTVGFKVGVEVSGKVGIPMVAEKSVKVSAETSYSHKWGTADTETKTITWKASPVAEPNTTLNVLVTVKKTKLTVPYTMHADVKHLSGNWSREEIPGIFRGDLGHDLQYTLEDFDANGNAIGPATTTTTDP